jgi:hypothetical protein
VKRYGSWGSSVSTVFNHRLFRANGVLSPAVAEDFSSSLCVHAGSGAHPASYPMGTGGPFPGCKAQPGRDADHTSNLVVKPRMSRSYTSSPPCRLHCCSGTAFYKRYLIPALEDTYSVSVTWIWWYVWSCTSRPPILLYQSNLPYL